MRTFLFMLGVACYCPLIGTAQAPYPAAPAPAGNIMRAEYFFDADPGFGNGTVVSFTPAADIGNFSATITINGSGLSNGFHRLYIRTQDVNGRWSMVNNAYFDNYVVPVYASTPAVANLQEAEYFIDTDPGIGNGVKITLPAITAINSLQAIIDITSLSKGVHWLYIRTRDVAGKWSITNRVEFDNSAPTPYPTAPSPAPPIGVLEYFIDTDPGFGNGTPVTIPAQTDITALDIDIPVNSLAAGPHTLYIRSKQNPWSFTAYAEFAMGSLPLTWSYVKGELRNGASLISWGTAQESNTKDFVIEHSVDGMQYTAVGTLPAAGNSTVPLAYRFTHDQPASGMNYYRIRQRDLDSISALSKVIVLLNSNSQRETIVAPNPVTDVLHLVEPAAVMVKKAEVYDLNGRLLLTENFGGQLKQVISLNLQHLNAGQYIVKVTYGNNARSFKIMRQ